MPNTIHPNTLQAAKKRHRKQASDKQLIAIKLRSQGIPAGEALKRAGYSKSMQRVPKQVFTSSAIVTAVDKFKLELKDQGLTTDYISTKFKEWLDARDKNGDPDYHTQQEAYKFFKEVVLDQDLKVKEIDKGLSRRVTLEEFLLPAEQTISGAMPEIESTPHIAYEPTESEPVVATPSDGELII